MSSQKIFIGADYHGFSKKTGLIPHLTEFHGNFIEVEDLGTYSDEQNDYNDPAIAVAKAVKKNKGSFGILLCGSAHGVCIQANRFKGIRAINALTEKSAKLGREHDDANIICLSADMTNIDEMKKILYTFFHTQFGKEERRVRRIKKLDEGNYD